MNSPIFYLTFGSQYPREPHPNCTEAHRDGWVEVAAPNYGVARACVLRRFGTVWSMLYDQEHWTEGELAQYFPMGCIGEMQCRSSLNYGLNMRPWP